MQIKFQNTLSGQKEEFSPIEAGVVKMYNCGPTVYGPQHIGNLSMFVFIDTLRRTLEYFDYEVKQVINITDFGHLVSDADEGEDKMTKGLKNEGLDLTMENMKSLATKYADIFLSDIKKLNVKTEGTQFPYASDYIKQQKEMIKKLEEKGFAYQISDGVYFDTGKFPNYGKLGNINAGSEESRIGENKEKKNQKDFVLWKFSNNLGWSSGWGQGFPGWHIECSAMIFALLGEQIDIHTGGIEHIPIHHNNEIAQSEAASGRSPFSRFWLHREHLLMNGTKISKSLGNTFYLDDLIKKGIHPMSLRYLLLSAHYRTPANFTLEAVEGAQVALEKIVNEYANFDEAAENTGESVIFGENRAQPDSKVFSAAEVFAKFETTMADDLNTPVALSLLQEAKDRETVDKMDVVLGLNIRNLSEQIKVIPSEILDLQKQREEARKNNDWTRSDQVRDQIEHAGYQVKDQGDKTLITRTLASLTEDL